MFLYASVGHGMSRSPAYHAYHDELVKQLQNSEQVKLAGDVLEAFKALPRHLFLPGVPLEEAFRDSAIPIKRDSAGLVVSSSSQPTMMAIMLDQLQIEKDQNVLEIGTATGYNAAIMRHIVGDEGHVTTVEIEADLVRRARENLSRAGVDGVTVVEADGAQGYAPRAQYDRIVATAGVWDVPTMWLRQLKPRGRLVVPIWLDGVQVSAAFEEQPDGTYLSVDNRPCAFVYLRGEESGPEMRAQIGSTSLYLLADQIKQIDPAALAQLLSETPDNFNIEGHLSTFDYWHGFQLYLMLNEPDSAIFAVYAVVEDRKAFGLEGSGIALLGPASAAFAPYKERGVVHTFGGSYSFLAMHEIYDRWVKDGMPRSHRLRLRLIPRDMTDYEFAAARVYKRRDHHLAVWLETDNATSS